MSTALQRILIESIGILLLGGCLGLLANALSPEGLHLSRDYFRLEQTKLAAKPSPPESPPPPAHGGTSVSPSPSPSPGGGETTAPIKPPIQQEQSSSFPEANLDQVQAWHQDPGFAAGLILLLDARNGDLFQQGHIPGAFHFDPYRVERHIETILPLAQLADTIVVYCSGGTCEDSKLAAQMLTDLGVPRDRIHIFTSGINAWKAAELPVEQGL